MTDERRNHMFTAGLMAAAMLVGYGNGHALLPGPQIAVSGNLILLLQKYKGVNAQ